MKLLIDMNLSPEWVPVLKSNGWDAVHWSSVGDPQASDRTIMDWARANGYAIFTHDLDFGTILAVTHAQGPSVLQARTQDVTPDHLAGLILGVLHQHGSLIDQGALVIVDEVKSRARILPLTY
jgi:predicted nuclease of predicted toxin-antitoxin system